MTVTGKDLIAAGAVPGKWFPEALRLINDQGLTIGQALSRCEPAPALPLSPAHSKPIYENIRSENEAEAANVLAVKLTM